MKVFVCDHAEFVKFLLFQNFKQLKTVYKIVVHVCTCGYIYI